MPTASRLCQTLARSNDMSTVAALLLSRSHAREAGALTGAFLIERISSPKKNRTGGMFGQRQEVRAGTAPERSAEFRVTSGASFARAASTEALGQQTLPRSRTKVQALCASPATKSWRRVVRSNTMLAPDVRSSKKAQLEIRSPIQVQHTPGRCCLGRIRAPSPPCQRAR